MTLDEIIRKRRSVRQFQDRPVDQGLLAEIINLSQKGPSAGGIRGYKIVAITHQIISYKAPAYAVICVDQEAYAPRYGARGRDLYAIQDAAIAGAYLQLLLVDRGLASCWVGAFNEDRLKKVMGLHLRPVAVIAMGYAA